MEATVSITVIKGVFVRRVCGAFAYVPAAIWDPLFKDLRKNEMQICFLLL